MKEFKEARNKAYDPDKIFLDQDEFIDFITEGHSTNMEELVEAFRTFGPSDDTKAITKEELKKTMEKYGEKYSPAEFDLLFSENDADGDGFINFTDFIKVMMYKQ